MIRKALLSFRLTAACCFRNKLRTALTVSGICLGLVVFLLGNAVLEGYLTKQFRLAESFSENCCIVNGFSADVDWFTQQCRDRMPIRAEHFSVSDSYKANQMFLYDGHRIQNNVRVVGAERGMDGDTVPSYHQSQNTVFAGTGKLLYGQDLSFPCHEDSDAVCVVEKSTAMLLFQKENAVGSDIHLESPNGFFDLKVIGVIDDLYTTRERNFQFHKALDSESNAVIYPVSYVYVPNSLFLRQNGLRADHMQNMAIIQTDAGHHEELDHLVQQVQNTAVQQRRAVNVKSRVTLIREANQSGEDFRIISGVCVITLFAVSGFIILAVLLFSIKERVYEIGIRRAVGASAFSILRQFLAEGILLSLISAVFAVILASFLCNYTIYFLRNVHYIDFILVMRPKLILATFGLSVLQGIVFSFLPAAMAAGIRPTEAIRWD